MQIYLSIEDLPIYNYFKCIEKRDLKFLVSDGSEQPKKELEEAYIKVENELIELNLKNPEFVADLKEEAEHYILKIETKINKSALNNILYLESKKQFEEEKKDNKPFDFNKSLIYISKFLGYRFDPKVNTVSEYFTAINTMKDGR